MAVVPRREVFRRSSDFHWKPLVDCSIPDRLQAATHLDELRNKILGITLLILGSFYYAAPDWDIPISFIMAIFTYITAPWSMRVLLERRWQLWPLVFFFTWFSVDGCYAIYWHFKNPVALEQMRKANFPASLALYGICGLIWLYRGSLKQIFDEIQDYLKSKGQKS